MVTGKIQDAADEGNEIADVHSKLHVFLLHG